MENQTDTILEDLRVFLLEVERIQSKMTTASYLGNVKQLLKWMQEEEVKLEDLNRMLMIGYLR